MVHIQSFLRPFHWHFNSLLTRIAPSGMYHLCLYLCSTVRFRNHAGPESFNMFFWGFFCFNTVLFWILRSVCTEFLMKDGPFSSHLLFPLLPQGGAAMPRRPQCTTLYFFSDLPTHPPTAELYLVYDPHRTSAAFLLSSVQHISECSTVSKSFLQLLGLFSKNPLSLYNCTFGVSSGGSGLPHVLLLL